MREKCNPRHPSPVHLMPSLTSNVPVIANAIKLTYAKASEQAPCFALRFIVHI